jgi:hypothetical protein
MKNLGHLMLDLETMGKRAGCAIVSIGAVEFDLETGEMGRKFSEPVDLQSCLNVGLFVEASTIYWWMMQSEEARKELCKPADSIVNVLEAFTSFLHCLGDFQIWGNGASFDMSILEAAYFAIGRGEILPWKFRNERDVRTLVSFAPTIKESFVFNGIMHHSIDDCKYQIGYCTAIWQKLKTNRFRSLSL